MEKVIATPAGCYTAGPGRFRHSGQGEEFSLLTTLSISEYANKLASTESAPGGGSAAALSGLLGASLLEMVINLTQGRKSPPAQSELLTREQADLTRLRIELQLLIDRDASAFMALVEAQMLPGSTRTERQERTDRIQEAARQAAEVPLWTARSCLEVMEISKALMNKVDLHLVSDLMIGALTSHTGVVGALLNTAVNLPLLEDENVVSAYNGQIHLMRLAADEMIAVIQKQAYAKTPFRVMREEVGG